MSGRRWAPTLDLAHWQAEVQRIEVAMRAEPSLLGKINAGFDLDHAERMVARARGLTSGQVRALLLAYNHPENIVVDSVWEAQRGSPTYRALRACGYASDGVLTDDGFAEATRILTEHKTRRVRKAVPRG